MNAIWTLARRLRAGAEGAAAGAAAALLFVLLDGMGRARWGAEGPASHLAAAGALLAAIGAAAMAVIALVTPSTSAAPTSLSRAARSYGVPASIVAALVAAALSGVVIRAPIFGVSLTEPLRVALPIVGFAGTALAVFAWHSSALRCERLLPFVAHSVASVGFATVLLIADARVMRGRHPGIHLAIEIVAFFLLAATLLRVARRLPHARPAWLFAGIGALATCAVLVASPDRREAHLVALRHLSDEPSNAGMLYTRALGNVARPQPVAASPVELDRWRVGEPETEEQSADLARVRATCPDCNIVVFFVDTLRADTARDPSVMPATAAFADSSIHFSSAYSTASDTLGTLSSLLSGRYDGDFEHGLLRQVRAHDLDNGLFISTSAHTFLSAQVPELRFDHVVTVPDHSENAPVWGYGADTPTGPTVVQKALSWMRLRGDKRFFAWVYNFDLHAWRQIRDQHFRRSYRDDPARPEKRYRAVATMVDKSFRSLLEGLDRLGIADKTIVLLVSDHGEALGYRGFWAHSTFLWESLVRVPLSIRVPGLDPREVTSHASLVDITPTLARFLDPSAETTAYQGVDLLRFYVDPESERALPLLLTASDQGKPTLYGLVSGNRKLVVAKEGGPPLLHDLEREDPDDADLTKLEPDVTADLLEQLKASPLMAR